MTALQSPTDAQYIQFELIIITFKLAPYTNAGFNNKSLPSVSVIYWNIEYFFDSGYPKISSISYNAGFNQSISSNLRKTYFNPIEK